MPASPNKMPLSLWILAGSCLAFSLSNAALLAQSEPAPAPPAAEQPAPPPDDENPGDDEGDDEGEESPEEGEQPAPAPADAPKEGEQPQESKPEEKPTEKPAEEKAAEPAPEPPPAPPVVESRVKPREVKVEPPVDERGRRVTKGETTTLAFKNVTVERVIPFIVESTGKVVIPQQDVLSRRVTIINDKEIPQAEALDLVFLALQQSGIAVVETQKLILLRDIAEIDRQDVPVIGPDESVLDRHDYGNIAEKVYRLENVTAESLKEALEDAVPEYATIMFEEESNQIVVRGNVALLQRMERLIDALDRPNAASLRTETFLLRYADAEQIANNIKELFAEGTSSAQGGNQRQNNPFNFNFGGQQQQWCWPSRRSVQLPGDP